MQLRATLLLLAASLTEAMLIEGTYSYSYDIILLQSPEGDPRTPILYDGGGGGGRDDAAATAAERGDGPTPILYGDPAVDAAADPRTPILYGNPVELPVVDEPVVDPRVPILYDNDGEASAIPEAPKVFVPAKVVVEGVTADDWGPDETAAFADAVAALLSVPADDVRDVAVVDAERPETRASARGNTRAYESARGGGGNSGVAVECVIAVDAGEVAAVETALAAEDWSRRVNDALAAKVEADSEAEVGAGATRTEAAPEAPDETLGSASTSPEADLPPLAHVAIAIAAVTLTVVLGAVAFRRACAERDGPPPPPPKANPLADPENGLAPHAAIISVDTKDPPVFD